MEKIQFLSVNPVRNFEEIQKWLLKNIKISNGVKNLAKIPKTPGVYFLCVSSGKPIYIGKASSLQERVMAHFKNPGFLLKNKIQNVKKISFVKTGSEIEALLLESRFIKKYQPKLNIMWKDDKRPFFVGITREPLPKVFITHQPSTIVKKSKIQNPKSKIPRPERPGSRSRSDLGINSKSQNSKPKIFYIGPFVEGRPLKQVLRFLRRIFPFYTRKHGKLPCFYCHLDLCPGPNPDSEEYRKNIKKLTAILQGKQRAVLEKLKKEMKFAAENQEFEKAAKIRDQVLALENIFEHARLRRSDLITEAQFNATRKDVVALLKQCLGLERFPRRIEAYDVSNIQGQQTTGSMVTFINGEPDKNFYRKFKIIVSGKPNDVAMIKEVLTRRFKHHEWPYPDLILIDGGKPQLNIAVDSKSQITNSKEIKILSLAKKENKLYIEGKKTPILLKNLPKEVANLILHLRDEAHRFAVKYHRKLRKLHFAK